MAYNEFCLIKHKLVERLTTMRPFATSTLNRLFTLISLLFCLALISCGTPTPPPRPAFVIGVVSNGKNLDPVLAGFKAGMADLGYVEGKTITYVYNGPAASPDKVDPIAEDLMKAKVDLILALGTESAKAAYKVINGTTVPVVFVPVGNPVKAGIVQSIQNPGGNVTGITTGLEYHAQRLEWLKKIAPNTKRVYVPYNPGDANPTSTLPIVKEAAAKLGIDLVVRETPTNDDVTAAIDNIPDDVDSIFMLADALVNSRLSDFVKVSLQRKFPLSTHITSMTTSGALFSYGFDQSAAGKQAARLVDKIIKGAKPSDLPVETSEFFLAVNLKTANAIGLNIGDDILRQATTIVRE
jgi:putative ABC transport system substrate-binding protein